VLTPLGSPFPWGWSDSSDSPGPNPVLRWVSREEKIRCQCSHLRFVRTLDFGVLDGLGMRAAAEIRDAEDALIAFTEQQAKRDALHVKTKEEIAAKYDQQDRLGGAA
jgi:hypothetical protein